MKCKIFNICYNDKSTADAETEINDFLSHVIVHHIFIKRHEAYRVYDKYDYPRDIVYIFHDEEKK